MDPAIPGDIPNHFTASATSLIDGGGGIGGVSIAGMHTPSAMSRRPEGAGGAGGFVRLRVGGGLGGGGLGGGGLGGGLGGGGLGGEGRGGGLGGGGLGGGGPGGGGLGGSRGGGGDIGCCGVGGFGGLGGAGYGGGLGGGLGGGGLGGGCGGGLGGRPGGLGGGPDGGGARFVSSPHAPLSHCASTKHRAPFANASTRRLARNQIVHANATCLPPPLTPRSTPRPRPARPHRRIYTSISGRDTQTFPRRARLIVPLARSSLFMSRRSPSPKLTTTETSIHTGLTAP